MQNDEWVTVEGTLVIDQYQYGDMSFDDLQIQVTKVEPAEPAEGYVYPY